MQNIEHNTLFGLIILLWDNLLWTSYKYFSSNWGSYTCMPPTVSDGI